MKPFLAVIIFLTNTLVAQQTGFVKASKQQFTINGKPYYFVGTNYWYGGLLALQKDGKRGKERLRKELDFLQQNGVNNLRVLVGAEGTGIINGVNRVSPPLQPTRGVFNDEVLNSLDFLLMEMGKRNMKAVLYLSNNWEWSGGFLQYLNWNGKLADSTLKRKPGWDELRDQVSQFYTCEPCKADYEKQLRHVLAHTNSYTATRYTNDPAIMSWEIANEPRPMRPAAVEPYMNWIQTVATLIKSLDKNHLVTTGTEGSIGTENRAAIYSSIHATANIDYLTIHIWPKNWAWIKDSTLVSGLPAAIRKTTDYIRLHQKLAGKLAKPLVIEEFGLPRDAVSFSPQSGTTSRDAYYTAIFEELKQSKASQGEIAGVNFWAFGGTARPKKGQLFWKDGDDHMGDPPQEEQGLNTVFDSDKSTWVIIKAYAAMMNQ